MRILLISTLLACSALACRGCAESPPFDAAVFTTPESVEQYGMSVCDPEVGIVVPLPTCHPSRPCTRVLPVPGGEDTIAVPTQVPDCETAEDVDDHPRWSDGGPQDFIDRDNIIRRYCLYDPEQGAPMPLVLWYHGTGGSADNVYDHTGLRDKARHVDLGGPQPGFALLSIEGRNLHWPTADPRDGPHHDVFHRDLNTNSANRDVALADRLIDKLVDDGVADPRRIYVMGWSNGMHFAQLYGIARHDAPTAGGNRIAAIAGFSAADPYNNRAFEQTPSCQLAQYPRSQVPLLLIGRSCDAIPCSDEQYQRAIDKDRPVAPGTSQETWMRTLAQRIANPNARRIIIDNDGNETASCLSADKCRATRALRNHIHWPDGISDGGGRDWEPTMLDFLRDNPLPGG